MVFMLAIVAFCVVCLIHREKSAFVVGDQLRHGTPCAFWWAQSCWAMTLQARAPLQHNPTFLAQSILSQADWFTLFFFFFFYEEVGENKAQTNTRFWNKTEKQGKFNWSAAYSAKQEGRRHVKRKSQIYSISNWTFQVYPPWQQILHISGVRLHYGFKALFQTILNTRVTTPPGFF